MEIRKILKAVLFYFSLFAVTVVVASAGYYISYQKQALRQKEKQEPEENDAVIPEITFDMPKTNTEKEPDIAKEAEVTEVTPDSAQEAMAEKVHYRIPSFGSIVLGYNDKNLEYSELFGDWRTHPSIDFDASSDSSVTASAGGIVSKIYTHPVFGKTVVINHENNIATTYAPVDALDGIQEGTKVLAGEQIGSCTGKVLYFEALDNGKPFNPF